MNEEMTDCDNDKRNISVVICDIDRYSVSVNQVMVTTIKVWSDNLNTKTPWLIRFLASSCYSLVLIELCIRFYKFFYFPDLHALQHQTCSSDSFWVQMLQWTFVKNFLNIAWSLPSQKNTKWNYGTQNTAKTANFFEYSWLIDMKYVRNINYDISVVQRVMVFNEQILPS